MERKQNLYGLLFCVWALTSCHSPANKGNGQGVPKKDTVKTIAQAPPQKKATGAFVILDTVAGKDTLKVVLFRDSMIRCSINNLADTFNAGPLNLYWDTSSFKNGNLAPSIIVPGYKKPRGFILNDSLLLITVPSWRGNMALFLLNRTKTSLRFTKRNKDNPIFHTPYYIYVDMKNNISIDHDGGKVYDDEDVGDYGQEHGRFLIYRYKIEPFHTGHTGGDKHFVQTGLVASSLKELDRMYTVDDSKDSNERAFYNIIVHNENWKRDRYDSDNYQKVIVLDTIAGKDTIHIAYDNKGNVLAIINHEADTIGWDETWVGYEQWRGKDDNQIIVPGGSYPQKFILNDSLLIFTLRDKYQYANLFYIIRSKHTFDISPDFLSTETKYLYIDLKRNNIIEQAGRLDDYCRIEYKDAYSEKIPFTVNRYRIWCQKIVKTDSAKIRLKGLNDIKDPDSYDGSIAFYNIVTHYENWKPGKYPPNPYQKVVIVDTVVGKDTIKVTYDSKGCVTSTLNGNSRSDWWNQTWIGYEQWRTKLNCIIVPGETKPRAFILNDSVLLFAVMQNNKYPILLMFNRTNDSLKVSPNGAGGGCKYIYVDLKTNSVIDNRGLDYMDYRNHDKRKNTVPENLHYCMYRYKITHDSLHLTDSDTSFFKEFHQIGDLDHYQDSKLFYDIIVKHNNWIHDR